MQGFPGRIGRLAAGPILVIGMLLLGACGGDAASTDGAGRASPSESQKVIASDRVYAIEDLLATGFKKSKQYDVEGLPEATAAVAGFWGPDPYKRKDLEIRFYASHADAVEHGTAMAEEASGEDALLDEETATWKVGVKDRKKLASGGSDDLAAWSGTVKPKYADFAVFGNMVILCEGLNPEEAMAFCASFIDVLAPVPEK